MLNKTMIIGNLGQEPELNFTPNGKAVVKFSVATSSGFGENKSTEWFNVVAWEKLAELCNERLNKGSKVYVEGQMRTRSWEGTDGDTKYKTELNAQSVIFLDKSAGAGEGGDF